MASITQSIHHRLGVMEYESHKVVKSCLSIDANGSFGHSLAVRQTQGRFMDLLRIGDGFESRPLSTYSQSYHAITRELLQLGASNVSCFPRAIDCLSEII